MFSTTEVDFIASTIHRRRTTDVSQYFEPWKVLRDLIRSPEDVRRVAREAADDARLDGVVYVEFRSSLPGMVVTDGTAPQTLIPAVEYLQAIAAGFAESPGIICKLVASIPRHVIGLAPPSLIEKYTDDFFRIIARFKDDLIVGIDLTGVERGWPAHLFKDIFVEAANIGLPITIHAGETEGPEEVWVAIEELRASRIGHGTSVPLDSRLVQAVIDRGIVLEVCPTSSWLTGRTTELYLHPVIQHRPRLPYVIATDNPTLNGTTLSNELRLAAQIAGVAQDSFVEAQFALARRAAFIPTQSAKIFSGFRP